MSLERRRTLIAGVCYLLTVVTSIPALALKAPVLTGALALDDPAAGIRLRTASMLEVVLAVSCVGTAIALHPILRRVGEAAALGFVAARTVEAGAVLLGVVALLALAHPLVGGSATGVTDALVAVHDGAFLLGPGLIPGINALLLGSLILRARLVPRIIPLVGLVGSPLLLASALATMTGVVDQVSVVAGIAALPVAAWEITLGVWLVVRGFRPMVDRPTHHSGARDSEVYVVNRSA